MKTQRIGGRNAGRTAEAQEGREDTCGRCGRRMRFMHTGAGAMRWVHFPLVAYGDGCFRSAMTREAAALLAPGARA